MADLPPRRECETVKLEHRGHHHFLGLGIHPTSRRVLECFLKGPQAGSDLEALTNQTCILASHLMQKADLTPRQVLDLVNLNTETDTGVNSPTLLVAVLMKAAEIDEERLDYPKPAS